MARARAVISNITIWLWFIRYSCLPTYTRYHDVLLLSYKCEKKYKNMATLRHKTCGPVYIGFRGDFFDLGSPNYSRSCSRSPWSITEIVYSGQNGTIINCNKYFIDLPGSWSPARITGRYYFENRPTEREKIEKKMSEIRAYALNAKLSKTKRVPQYMFFFFFYSNFLPWFVQSNIDNGNYSDYSIIKIYWSGNSWCISRTWE